MSGRPFLIAAIVATLVAAVIGEPTAASARPGADAQSVAVVHPNAVVNNAATPASVIAYLSSLEGNHTISGQHNAEPNSTPAQYTNQVDAITGVYPGLWGGDFLYESDSIAARQTMINEAESEWADGSLVTLMWHECPPTMSEPCDWTHVESAAGALSTAQWQQLVTSGTALNTAWKNELNIIVPYLQQLKAAGIPVLWRPLHEINDGWSWWGGTPYSATLWQITYNYLVNTEGLTNLIWVWSVKDSGATSALNSYYPGNQYVDVVALDPWNNGFPTTAWYQAMQSIAGSKPIALAEVGALPTPAQLSSQPDWTYFNCWASYLTSANTNASTKATYYDPQVLHRGDIHLPTATDTTPPTAPAGLTVTGHTSSSVTLSWAASSDTVGVTGYQIRQGGSVVATVAATSGTITGLTPSTAYTFSVTAIDAAGNVSATSNAVTATTDAVAAGTDLALNKPVTATSFTQTYVAANADDGDPNTYWESTNNTFPQSITVSLGSPQPISSVVAKLPPAASWSTRTQTIAVSGSTDNTTYTPIVAATSYTFDPTGNTNTVTIPLPATTARYVRLTFTANTGWPAGQLSDLEVFGPAGAGDTTPPTAPANLAVTGHTPSSMSLSWSASTDNVGVTGYQVHQNGAIVATVTATSYTASGLSPAATYSYAVTALDAAGNVSTSSNTITGNTDPATATNLALGKAMTASGYTQTYTPSNTNDANTSTYWESTDNAFPQWLQVDLGASTSVGRVVLTLPPSWGARTQTLSIAGSTNGTTFTTIVGSAAYTFDPNTGANTVTITFPATATRYLRLTITANTGWPAGQISEFQAWSA